MSSLVGEVNKFADLVELGIVLNRFFEEVLDGFYIVVGSRFDGFDTMSLIRAEVFSQIVQKLIGFSRKGGHFSDLVAGRQRLQPANFNGNAVTN